MSQTPSPLESLEVFIGAASDAVCRLYARLPRGENGTWRLSGTVNGPSCDYAHTLPARGTLVDRGPGEWILAEAILPEPCYWTPDLPHLYQLSVTLSDGERELATTRATIGLRRLGGSRRKLILEAERWVLRGVQQETVPAANLTDWHAAAAAIAARDPSESLCSEASRCGVLVVALLNRFDRQQFLRLTHQAAVGIAALPRGTSVERLPANNLILAEQFAAGDAVTPSPWAELALCEVGDVATFAARVAACQIPIIAMQDLGLADDVATARGWCDTLQAQLAGKAELSGYIV